MKSLGIIKIFDFTGSYRLFLQEFHKLLKIKITAYIEKYIVLAGAEEHQTLKELPKLLYLLYYTKALIYQKKWKEIYVLKALIKTTARIGK